MKKMKDTINLTPKEDDNLTDTKIDTSNKSLENETTEDMVDDLDDNSDEEDLYSENALELSRMSFKEKCHYKKELRKKRLSTMDKDEKRKYVVHYYKWHFLGGILCIFLLFWLGQTIYKANLPTALILAITNDGANYTAEEYIPEAFRDYYSLDKKNIIQIFTDLEIANAEDARISDGTLTDYEKVIVYISSDKLDAIIGDENALNYYKSTGDIAIIDNCMDKDLYSQLEDKIVMATDDTKYMNNGEPYAAAIDISNTDFVKDSDISYDTVYLMIPNNRYSDNEATLNLIKMIFGL